MRIDTLTVEAYGPFTDLSLDFRGPQRQLHVIHGLNEAGKTSLLRAITGLLFRIDRQCADNFIHSNPDLKVTAAVSTAQGDTRTLSRLKRNDPSLRDEYDNPVEEAVLASILGGIDRDVFLHFFGLTHESLREGGKAMVAGEGEIGRSLFESGGLSGLSDLLASYKKEADKLFLRRGQRELNTKFTQIEAARAKARAALLRSSEWGELKKNQKRRIDELTEAQLNWTELTREWERLRRIHDNKPDIAERERLVGELALLGDVPELCSDFEERRLGAETAARNAQGRIAQLERRLQQKSGALLSIPADLAILQYASPVRDLQRRIEQYRSLVIDRQKRQSASEEARTSAAVLWQQLFPGRKLEEVAQFRLTASQETALRTLNEERLRLETMADAAEETASGAREQLESLQEQLGNQPLSVDRSPLASTVDAIRGQGRLEDRVLECEKAVAGAQYKVQQALHNVPCWTHAAESLAALKIPSEPTLQRFEHGYAGLQERASSLTQRHEHAAQRLATLRKELARLVRERAVPTEQQLREEREIRDLGWSLIRQFAFEHSISLEDAVQQYDPSAELSVAFEKHLRQADSVADLLRTDADRVSTHVQLTRQIEEEEQSFAAIAHAQAQLEGERKKLDAEWVVQWPELTFAPMQPPEMRAWCMKREALITALNLYGEQKRELQHAEAALKSARSALVAVLDTYGVVLGEKETLGAALLRAQRLVDESTSLEKQRSELQRRVQSYESTQKKAAGKLADVEQLTRAWQVRWQSATACLRIDDPQPTLVMLVVEKTREVLQLWDEHRRMADRVAAIEADIQCFEDDVRRIVTEITPNLLSIDCDAAVDSLVECFEQARQAQNERQRLDSEILTLGEELAEELDQGEQANAELAALRATGGCATNEELAGVGQRAVRKRELSGGLQLIEKTLVSRNGKTLPEIISEAADQDTDTLRSKVAETESHKLELEQKREQLLKDKINADRDLEEREHADAYASAVQDVQEHVSSARELTDRYVRSRLVVTILERSMEEYRTRYQGLVLQRASELFSRLTLGRYSGINVESDGGRTMIWAIRANRTNKRVAMSGLSDGSADQLFLALRIASIEQRVRTAEPVPCVFDDILVNFDDPRAMAALQVLAELSEHTQVLLLTHHDHVVSLAEKSIPDELIIHRLPAGEQPEARPL